jgi:hypothetical protein
MTACSTGGPSGSSTAKAQKCSPRWAEELLGALPAEHQFTNAAESARSLAHALDEIGDQALAASILNMLAEGGFC